MITHFLSTNELQIYTYNRKIIAKILTFNRPLWVTKSTGRLSLHILHTTYHTSALTAVLIHRDLHITVACGHQLQTSRYNINCGIFHNLLDWAQYIYQKTTCGS